jgi:hypothetical protein
MTSIMALVALLVASCGSSCGQKVGTPPSSAQHEIFLNRANDGQHVSAKVGQPIVVTLQTIGGGHYNTPQISSRAIRFESADDRPPREQNPGGPQQVYRFIAISEGEAQIRFTHTDANPTVTFTIQVKKR